MAGRREHPGLLGVGASHPLSLSGEEAALRDLSRGAVCPRMPARGSLPVRVLYHGTSPHHDREAQYDHTVSPLHPPRSLRSRTPPRMPSTDAGPRSEPPAGLRGTAEYKL